MNAAVRLIFFISDPFTGAREVVAAQVREGKASRVLRAPTPSLPLSARATVSRVLADLEAEPAFEALPVGAGPQVVATEAQAIPETVDEPEQWVWDVLLKPAA